MPTLLTVVLLDRDAEEEQSDSTRNSLAQVVTVLRPAPARARGSLYMCV